MKVGMPWPLEPTAVREFAQGLEEILVVEEKRQIVEYQIKEQLYNWRDDVRPRVVGKFDEKGEWVRPHGDWLLPAASELTPAMIARVIAAQANFLMMRARTDESLPLCDEAIAISHEQHLAQWIASGMVTRGIALAQLGGIGCVDARGQNVHAVLLLHLAQQATLAAPDRCFVFVVRDEEKGKVAFHPHNEDDARAQVAALNRASAAWGKVADGAAAANAGDYKAGESAVKKAEKQLSTALDGLNRQS